MVAVIGGTILSIPEVGAQSTGGDSTSCESSTLDEAVNLFKRGMNNIWLIREDLKAVNFLREDLEDVKNLLESNQQQNNASSSISEAVSHMREDLENVKNVLESNQQQNNATCVSKKEFEDLKAAFDELIQQQNNSKAAFDTLIEQQNNLKAAFDALIQQQNNASSIYKKDLEDLQADCVSNQLHQNNASANLIRENLEYVKNVLASIPQHYNVSSSLSETVSLVREELKDVNYLLLQHIGTTGINLQKIGRFKRSLSPCYLNI